MKKLIQSLAVAALVMSFTSISAQDRRNNDSAEISRYAEKLNLTPEQQKELTAIYSESASEMEASRAELTKLREERMSNETPLTAEEKAKWSSMKDEAVKKNQTLTEDRNKRMMDILDDEQLASYKKWQDKRGSQTKPVEEARPMKDQARPASTKGQTIEAAPATKEVPVKGQKPTKNK